MESKTLESKILFSELVSSKLLHDISGFISVVVNTAACLSENEVNQTDLNTLNFYGDALLNSVKIFRQAYALSDDNNSPMKTLENLELYFQPKNVYFDWNIAKDDDASIKNPSLNGIMKTLVNVLIYFGSKIPKISSIETVFLGLNDENVVEISANIKAPVVYKVLFDHTDIVKQEDFHHKFIVNLLKAYNVTFLCSISEASDRLDIILKDSKMECI